MKRLLCIISIMDTGGAETFLMKLYRALDRTKYQMDFCVCSTKKGFYDDEIEHLGGIIYHIVPKTSNLNRFKQELYDVVKSNHYEYVLRITSNAAGFLDLKVAKLAGAKVCIARSSNSRDSTRLKSRIAHRIGGLLYTRYVDVKIAPSDLAAKYTFGEKAYTKGNVNILHNAIDLNIFRFSNNERNRIRYEYNCDEQTLVVGHVGRFTEQKNHSYLIDIFGEIHKRNSNSKLFLIGKGELEDSIRQKVQEYGLEKNVVFLGVRDDIPSLLSSMDVFIFPSIYEGMPNVIIEAQAIGLPCIISDRITNDAKIIDSLVFCSLEKSPLVWAELAIEKRRTDFKKNYKSVFVKAGYDIESQVNYFTKLVFNEK